MCACVRVCAHARVHTCMCVGGDGGGNGVVPGREIAEAGVRRDETFAQHFPIFKQNSSNIHLLLWE